MRWGIVGTGAIAARFVTACQRLPDTECVAVSSRTAANGQAFADRYGIGHVATNAGDLAAQDAVDVVYVATPNHCHVDDALAVIDAGKPVLCEKPLATNADDARSIAGAARAKGVFCMEGMWSLCTPVYTQAFQRVANGDIGKVRQIEGSFSVPQTPETMPRLFDSATGGGALLDRGVYLIALSMAVLGDLRLRHVAGDLAPEGVDLAATLILESDTGARAVLSTAIDRFGDNSLTIEGSTGRCVFAQPVTCPVSYALTRRDPSAAFRAPAGASGPVAALKARLRRNPLAIRAKQALAGNQKFLTGGLENEIAEVERCLAQGLLESPLVPLDRSIRTLAIIDEARKALSDRH